METFLENLPLAKEKIYFKGELKAVKGKFILSINDLPETRQIFRAFEFLEVQTKYSCAKNPSSSSKLIAELLVKNF